MAGRPLRRARLAAIVALPTITHDQYRRMARLYDAGQSNSPRTGADGECTPDDEVAAHVAGIRSIMAEFPFDFATTEAVFSSYG